MKIKRREFITRSALGVGGLLLGTRLAAFADTTNAPAAATVIKDGFDPYETVQLGKTPLKVSRVCMGTGAHGFGRASNQTRLGIERFHKVLRGAYERGVTTFDLADNYGSHPYLIPALKGIPRDKFVIFTKIWWRENGGRNTQGNLTDADATIARFLKEIQTDHLDLVLLHLVTSPTWPDELRKQMDTLTKLKEKGTIRALGVSCHSLEALEAAVKEPWVESVHARINPYGASMDGAPDKVIPILKKLHEAGKGVVGMKIIGAGEFSNSDEKRNASVKLALQLGCVDVLNVGFENEEQIDDLATRVRNVPRSTTA